VSERTFDIDPQVRQMVTFSYLNLAEDSYPSLRNNTNAMDLILCRNVLIYFGHQMRKHVLAGMHRSLAEGGCLLVSPVEASRQQFGAYEQRSIDGVTFYCRGGAGRPKTEAVPEQPAYKESAKAASLPPSAPLQAPAVSVPATPPLPEMPARPPAPRQVEQKAHREGNFYHAEHLFKQGHYEEAAAELLICTPAPRVQLLLSRAYANLGDFDLAHHWCSAAIQSNPLDPHARYLLSTILQEQGRIEEAVAALRHTLYLDQHFILAHYSLASLLSQSGKKDLAHRHFQNAYQMASELPDQQVVPESDGLPAGRLVELIRLSLQAESNT
jgi:chemotaxis protein methyltransferase CheR